MDLGAVPRRHTDVLGRGLTLALIVIFRFTTPGRRFQVVGANPTASWIAGLRVNLNQVSAYVVAAVLYAVAGILLASFLRTISITIGAPYLLGPIAAVVIGGASLTGGLASPLSTWAAAFFLAGLTQMMRVMGLPTALQFVVFGLVIVGGMLVSGDRIIRGVEQVLRERKRLDVVEAGTVDPSDRSAMRKEARISESHRSRMASAIDQRREEEHATDQDHRHHRAARSGGSGM